VQNYKVELWLNNKTGEADNWVIVDTETIPVIREGNDGATGPQGVSVVSQTTYYALIHPDYTAGDIAKPASDNDLQVKTKTDPPAILTVGEQTLGPWSLTPPEHTDLTIQNYWKYWTTVKTEYSEGESSFSVPIIDEALNGVYELAQGKTTNYYSEFEPTRNARAGEGFVYKPKLKEDDCWFDTINKTLKQCVGFDESGNAVWVDIGGELVANKVTATYVNALDITAKKIDVGSTFSADADSGNVKIGGFTVEDDKLHYYDENHEYDYGGTIQKGTGVGIGAVPNEGSWAFWAGTQTGDGIETKDGGKGAYGHDAPFRVGHDGALFATRGEISGFELAQQDNKPVFKSKRAALVDSISKVSECYTFAKVAKVEDVNNVYEFESSSGELTLTLNDEDVTKKYNILASKNKGVANSAAVVKLQFTKKLPDFSFYIVSSGEPKDYILTSKLNVTSVPTSANDTKTFVSASVTSITQSSTPLTVKFNNFNNSTSPVAKVTYTSIKEGDFCYIVFRKDKSTNSYLDKG
jgi:hypothetical protein